MDRININGVKFFRLYCKCPNCTENGKNVPPAYWYCDSCGGELYVGDNACLYCKGCGRERHILQSAFKCPYCCHVDDEVVDLNRVYLTTSYRSPYLPKEMVGRVGIHWATNFLINCDS